MNRIFWLPLLAVALLCVAATGASAQFDDGRTPVTAAAVPGGSGAEPLPFTNNPAAGFPPYTPVVSPFPPNAQIAQQASLGATAAAGIPAPVANATAISITDNYIYVISGGVLLKYDRNFNLIQQVSLPNEGGQAIFPVGPPAIGRGPAWVALLTGPNAQGYSFGKGVAYVWMDPSGQALHYLVNLTNVDNITGVYIQYLLGNLPPEQAPPVAPLYVGSVITRPFTGTLAQGTLTSDNLINMMAEHPLGNLVWAIADHRAIVTVHTTQRPQGELTGKLVPMVTGS